MKNVYLYIMEDIEHNSDLLDLIKKATKYFREHYLEERKRYLNAINSPDNKKTDDRLGLVHIYSHLDADGLTAASIIAKALKREQVGYQISILKQLEKRHFHEIQENILENKHFPIFTDFGSGQLNLFQEYVPNASYIILDHHQVLKDEDGHAFNCSGFHANPEFVGIDGSKEISGAGMAYLFAKELNNKNIELSYIPIIGAIGDIQNTGKQKSFMGENQAILKDAVSDSLILKEIAPAIVRSKSLAFSLAYTLNVDIKKIKGDIRKAARFLKRINIKTKTDLGEYRTLADLNIG
ncbi:MAG: hypothetical protein GF364_22455, partial [Candidatus Lokiarchaeota archaeon]|nr:hypothetical protein [Candidatus Lokiarchaeota archaeon]